MTEKSTNNSKKIIFIQGGSKGIGAAIAKKLADKNTIIIITYFSSTEKANILIHELKKSGNQGIAIYADSRNAADIESAINLTIKNFGKIDILINNTGVLTTAPLNNLTIDEFDNTIATNVRSIFIASKLAFPYISKYGKIINLSSVLAYRIPFQGCTAYSASKAAIIGLTKAMARDLAPYDISVNCILPGPINTDMNPALGSFANQMKSHTINGRFGNVDEVANLVFYLSSPESSYMTGAEIVIDGGFTI